MDVTELPKLTTSVFDFGTLEFTSASEGKIIQPSRSIWTIYELKILGAFLWVAIVITLVGNISCFYAVWKNLKKILEHPFFQSNVFCVYLSFVDIVLVILVGVPTALAYTTNSLEMQSSKYNLMVVDPLCDYLVWLQLLLIVAICVDRAGHIARPLTYTFGIRAYKTAIACATCTLLPFVTLIIPYITALTTSINNREKLYSNSTDEAAKNPLRIFACLKAVQADSKGNVLRNSTTGHPLQPVNIFASCVIQLSEDYYGGAGSFKMWENVSNCLIMVAGVGALALSNGLIVSKLRQSAKFQKENQERQEEVARGVRLTSMVTLAQVILILVSTLPFRCYQISRRLTGSTFNEFFVQTCRCMVFLGPMVDPWLYPIRMASIRTFLVTKKRSVVTSVRHMTNSSRYSVRSTRHRTHGGTNKYVSVEASDGGNNDGAKQHRRTPSPALERLQQHATNGSSYLLPESASPRPSLRVEPASPGRMHHGTHSPRSYKRLDFKDENEII